MTARSLFDALWRRRWLALAVLVVEFAAVALWLGLAPRQYTASATLTATPQQSLLQSTGNFDNLETTLAQIVSSRSVLQDVSARLPEKRSVDQLRDEVQGARVTGTVLIRITVQDKNPQTAADIANTVVDVLPLHDPSGGLFLFTQTDRAQSPAAFSSPNVKIIALVGVLLGILLAVVAALLRDSAARTVETPEQLEETAGAGVLAVIPRPRDPAALVADPQDPASPGFRALRVALEFAGSEHRTGTLVVAGVTPDAYDAWLAVNLAVALAQVRHHVLLIDASSDERMPHPVLDGEDSPGLFDALRGDLSLDAALRDGPVEGLTVLPSGHRAGRPTASLVELRFHQLLAEVHDGFDVVIVLAPPLTVSDDARVMAIGGSVVLAVPYRTVRAKVLRRLTVDLRSVQTRIVGSVLIGSRRRNRVGL